MANSCRLTLNIASVNKLGEELRRTAARVVDVGKTALRDIAVEIKDESYKQCPKGTGTLAESSYVEDINNGTDVITVRVGYGGPADKINPATHKAVSTYMVPVHERLDTRHPNGKAKFLEDPVNAIADQIEAKLAKGIDPAFKR